ncbi:unnamed protein product [Allacma fusca]|uniref:Superoxide dismutase [Cu-Zn] n=1 Tax=Allacma fusca TaxID=39272 RepID=A0A8J2JD94_9HEXA|nr:unnamed protein product [Allacma fusca]
MVKVLAIGVVAAIILGVIVTLVSVHGVNSGAITSLPCCHAVSVLNAGPAGTTVKGVLEFRQSEGSNVVSITGEISGFPPNTYHGFHIHESGDFRNEQNACLSAGPHYNPYMHTHGGPEDSVRHIGDLGNIYADEHGVAKIAIQDSLISLSGPLSVVGRTVVVHEKVDDLGKDGADSKNTGNAGARVACGIIGIIYEKPKQ